MDFIDKHIIKRSTRAIKCLSLNSNFYQQIQFSGLSAEDVFVMRGKYISNFPFKLKKAENIEDSFLWLIKIGILRREVDGQGLTSKVRITPLGRQIITKSPTLANQQASIFELTTNWISRRIFLK